VVDDEVGHHIMGAGEFADVLPGAESRIDCGVVGRVEAGIGPVEGRVERQDVDAAEGVAESVADQLGETGNAPSEPVGVGDQLNLVTHGSPLKWSWLPTPRHRAE